jgi:hypothetical protein
MSLRDYLGLEQSVNALGDELKQWCLKFEAYVDKHQPATTRALLLLRIQHFHATMTLRACRSTDEMFTDDFLAESSTILDNCEEYLRLGKALLPAEQRKKQPCNKENQQGGMTLVHRILPALFSVATKCRDGAIRRRAIYILMTANRREGLSYSRQMGAFASALLEIEERLASQSGSTTQAKSSKRDSQHPPRAHDVPAHARLSEAIVIGPADLHPHMEVWCAQVVADKDGKDAIQLLVFEGKGPPFRLEEVSRTLYSKMASDSRSSSLEAGPSADVAWEQGSFVPWRLRSNVPEGKNISLHAIGL